MTLWLLTGRILTAETPENDGNQIFFLTSKMPWIVRSTINLNSSVLEEKYKKHYIKYPLKSALNYPYNFKYMLLPIFESWPNFGCVFHIQSLNVYWVAHFRGLAAFHNVLMILSLFGTFSDMASIAGKIFSLYVQMWRPTTLHFIIQPNFYFEPSILDWWEVLAWLFLEFFPSLLEFHCGSVRFTQHSATGWRCLVPLPAMGPVTISPSCFLIPSNSTWGSCFSLQDCPPRL